MKKLIFLVLVCGLMISCTDIWPFSGGQHRDLPTDKIPILKNNDIVYFQDSISSKLDTFQLNINDFWGQTKEGNYFRYITTYYNNLNTKTTIFKTNINSSNVGGFGFNVWFSNFMYDYNNMTSNLKMNGVTYSNVYTTYLTNDTIPNKLYFTYKNGIIRYEYKDGRVYNLVSK